MKKKSNENQRFPSIFLPKTKKGAFTSVRDLFLPKAKKGAISIDVTIELVALVISFGLLIAILVPQITKWVYEESETSLCEWSIVVGAIARPLGKEVISPECKARKINISTTDLQPYLSEAEQTINKWKSDERYSRMLEEFPEATIKNEYKYALNKLVANELSNCWNKVLRGRLAMFDKWYNKIDFIKGDYPEYAEDYVSKTNLLLIDVWGAPKFCIICSNIKFNEDLKDLGLPANIDLTKWLQHTTYEKDKKKTIYGYLYDGQTVPSNLVEPEYTYEINPPNRYSIVYERINPHAIDDVIESSWDTINYLIPFIDENDDVPEVIHQLRLVPHDLVAKPYTEGGESCFKIIE